MHRFIAKIADNKKLEAYINDIQDFFAYSRPYTVKWTEAKIKRAINDHKELIDALCNGNEERAIEIIREDIEAMRDLLKDNNE